MKWMLYYYYNVAQIQLHLLRPLFGHNKEKNVDDDDDDKGLSIDISPGLTRLAHKNGTTIHACHN